MTDFTDDVQSGFLCEDCGAFIDGKVPGYPRKCQDCKAERKKP